MSFVSSVLCRATVVASLSLVISLAAWAGPQVLIDNLSELEDGPTVLNTSGSFPNFPSTAAQSFSSPSPFRLDTIETYLGDAFLGTDYFFELRTGLDPTGPAIAILAPDAIPELGSGLGLVTLTPDRTIRLRTGRTYWLVAGVASTGEFSWSYASTNDYSGPGVFGNFWYSYDFQATWADFGNVKPYRIRVNVLPTGCISDVDDGSGTGVPDGGTDINDLLYYLAEFEAGNLSADVDDGSGTGNPDDGVDINDLLYYLERFEAGC